MGEQTVREEPEHASSLPAAVRGGGEDALDEIGALVGARALAGAAPHDGRPQAPLRDVFGGFDALVVNESKDGVPLSEQSRPSARHFRSRR